MATKRNIDLPKDVIKVIGVGLSPRPSPSASPISNRKFDGTKDSSITSDDESEASSELTVLDGVRKMNDFLKEQITAIRRQIASSEQKYNEDKDKIVNASELEIQEKDTQIDILKDSLVDKDENIKRLTKEQAEKNKSIRDKSLQIDGLKSMIDQIKKKHRNINIRIIKLHNKPEESARSIEQDEQICGLNNEVATLHSRLGTMEEELGKAIEVINQQNEKLKILDEEKHEIQMKFKEEIDFVSKSLTEEVKRAKAALQQYTREIKSLRGENAEIHNTVNEIKNIIVNNSRKQDPPEATGGQQLVAYTPDQQRPMVRPQNPSHHRGHFPDIKVLPQTPDLHSSSLFPRSRFSANHVTNSTVSYDRAVQRNKAWSSQNFDNFKTISKPPISNAGNKYLPVYNLHIPDAQTKAVNRNTIIPPIRSSDGGIPSTVRRSAWKKDDRDVSKSSKK